MFPSTHDNQSGLGTSDSESHMVASHYDLVKMELLQQPPAKHITKKNARILSFILFRGQG